MYNLFKIINNILRRITMSKENNNIKCDVESCKHNEEKKCNLDEVKISCTCENNECNCIDETICESFEEQNDD